MEFRSVASLEDDEYEDGEPSGGEPSAVDYDSLSAGDAAEVLETYARRRVRLEAERDALNKQYARLAEGIDKKFARLEEGFPPELLKAGIRRLNQDKKKPGKFYDTMFGRLSYRDVSPGIKTPPGSFEEASTACDSNGEPLAWWTEKIARVATYNKLGIVEAIENGAEFKFIKKTGNVSITFSQGREEE